MNEKELEQLATRVDDFLKNYDYYSYIDNDCDYESVLEVVKTNPYAVIETLMNVIEENVEL